MQDRFTLNHPQALITCLLLLVIACVPSHQPLEIERVIEEKPHKVLLGIDVLPEFLSGIEKKVTVAAVVNHTSVNSDGMHLIDVLHQFGDRVELKVVFTPEHGLYGSFSAGEAVGDSILGPGRLQVRSLYGDHKLPNDEDLMGIDIVFFDLQDVGSRYYTYISTMTYVMEAAAKNGIKVAILDRPNPIGRMVRGPTLKETNSSMVGLNPVPIRHGMTVLEMADMINDSGWLSSGRVGELIGIEMSNYQPEQYWPDTGCKWIPPSPNLPDFETALIYNGLCLLEGTNVAEGRGTSKPFLTFGAPWIDGRVLTGLLNALQLPGLYFESTDFIPVRIPGKSLWPKYRDENCSGCRIHITDVNQVKPLELGIQILTMLHKEYPDSFTFLPSNFIDNLYGSDSLRRWVLDGASAVQIIQSWQMDEEKFILQRQGYLRY